MRTLGIHFNWHIDLFQFHFDNFTRYREVCDAKYNFDEENGTQKAGHFTQLVWKDSKKIGIGISHRQSSQKLNCTYVVARYRNAGNILGLFADEVQRGSFMPEMCNKITSMAESAVREADSSFDQANPISNVAKLHGFEVPELQPHETSRVSSGDIEGFGNSHASGSPGLNQRVLNWNNTSDGRDNRAMSQANLLSKIDSLTTQMAENGTLNFTIDAANADETIRSFFDSQSNQSQTLKGS